MLYTSSYLAFSMVQSGTVILQSKLQPLFASFVSGLSFTSEANRMSSLLVAFKLMHWLYILNLCPSHCTCLMHTTFIQQPLKDSYHFSPGTFWSSSCVSFPMILTPSTSWTIWTAVSIWYVTQVKEKLQILPSSSNTSLSSWLWEPPCFLPFSFYDVSHALLDSLWDHYEQC